MSRITASPVPTRRERARGRHAEMEHRLAADELAQRGAQHRAAVGGARVGRVAGAFELQLPAASRRRDHLGERDGAAVAELARPVAELVAAVARRVGLHAGQHAIAAEHFEQLWAPGCDQAELVRQARRTRRGVAAPRPASARRAYSRRSHLPRHVDQHRVGRQVAHEGVREGDRAEVDERRARASGPAMLIPIIRAHERRGVGASPRRPSEVAP